MDEKESRLIDISLAASPRFSFVPHVEEDTGCYFQVTVHGGNCELFGDAKFRRKRHLSNEYNVVPRS